MRYNVVVVLNLDREDRRTEEVFEGIDDAVEELEDKEGFDLRGGRGEEEEIGVCKAEDECGRARVGEVD